MGGSGRPARVFPLGGVHTCVWLSPAPPTALYLCLVRIPHCLWSQWLLEQTEGRLGDEHGAGVGGQPPVRLREGHPEWVGQPQLASTRL